MYGLPVLIARPSNPFGIHQIKNQTQGFIGVAMARMSRSETISVFGTRGTVRDYIDVDDLASGLCCCLASGWPGQVYNIGTGIGTDNLALLDLIFRSASRDIPDPRILFEPERQFDVRYNVLDASKLTRETGWVPKTSLSQGLGKMWLHLA